MSIYFSTFRFKKLDPEKAREEFGKIYTINQEKHRAEIDGKVLGDLIRERIDAAKAKLEELKAQIRAKEAEEVQE